MVYTLLSGNSIDQLKTLPDAHVQCILTSPPYLWLRDYQTEGYVWGGDAEHAHEWVNDHNCECGAWRGELGQEPTLELFVEHMVSVLREAKRVLRNDGVLWLNIGDTYLSNLVSRVQAVKKTGGAVKRPRRVYSGQTGIKRKDLVGVPWAIATALRADGWFLRQDVIWSKAGGNCPRCHFRLEKGSSLPEPVTDRFVRAHEYVFLLTKSKDYYFDCEAAKEQGATSNRRSVLHITSSNFRGAHFATMSMDLARVLVKAATSAHGACDQCGAPWERVVQRGELMLDKLHAAGASPDGSYDGQALKDYEAAKAQNPSDVKRRILNSMRERITTGWQPTCRCEAGVRPCVVLDPFSGAATTGVAALELGHDYIGIDADERCNSQIAKPRLDAVKAKMPAQQSTPTTLAGSGVYHGKAEDLLQQIQPGTVRLVLTDPPYNVSRANNFHTMGRKGIDFDWDGEFDQEEWLQYADKVLMPGGSLVIWNDWKVIGQVAFKLMEMGYDVKRPVTLIKSNPMPRNRDRSAVQSVEYGLWAVKPGAKWVFNRRPGAKYEDFVFTFPVPRSRKGRPRHEAKKPDRLYEALIEILSNPGDLVVDPFCGGGTLAYAAERLGRLHISIDAQEKWVAETRTRWNEAKL
jgi:site-specific DNA-methyltransferase (adenine-specific)